MCDWGMLMILTKRQAKGCSGIAPHVVQLVHVGGQAARGVEGRCGRGAAPELPALQLQVRARRRVHVRRQQPAAAVSQQPVRLPQRVLRLQAIRPAVLRPAQLLPASSRLGRQPLAHQVRVQCRLPAAAASSGCI